MTVVRELPESPFDVGPTPFVFETTPNQLGDERTASPRTGTVIEFGDEVIVERYVQTHVITLAHTRSGFWTPRPYHAAERFPAGGGTRWSLMGRVAHDEYSVLPKGPACRRRPRRGRGHAIRAVKVTLEHGRVATPKRQIARGGGRTDGEGVEYI